MLCPKCHRPLADDSEGPYICCADAPNEWQCLGCGKVSEGFALPYGRCPDCGGELQLRDAPREAPMGAALHALRMAFEIELGGRAFYQRAAAETTDPVLRQLFGRFAVMEGEHMETLSRRYHIDTPNPSPEFRLEVAALFADVAHRPEDPENLFTIAIGLEERAARFFTEHAESAPEGSAERALFRELAAEEREHAHMLQTELARWRQGRAGLFGGGDESIAATSPDGLMNAAALLLQGHEADRIALVCGDQKLTRGELRDRVARAAALWRQRGLERGHRVAIKLPDGLDWVVAFLATIWAGGTAVAVNPKVPAPEWQYILEEAGFTVILAETAEDTPSPWRERVVLVDESRHLVAAMEPMPPRLVDPDTPAFWVHSSGTSGKPKAVVHGHRFARMIESVSRDRLGITGDDRLFASSRLFFSYPQTNSLWAGLKLGATIILDPRWPTPEGVADIVRETRPTVLFSVPSLYRLLLAEGLAPGIAQAGVRLCVSAGEALPQSLRDAWREATGLSMFDGYGASETLVLVLTAREGDDGLQPSPGVKVSALDPDSAADGRPTRLRFKLDCQALGYLDRPASQADSFRDGAFCPADLFVATEGGGWRFAGREDTLLKIKGRWVNLNDLEERLSAGTAGLIEGAAVRITDADGFDALAYFYVARDGQGEAVEKELATRSQTLPQYQRPRWLQPVDMIPRTATGKLLRRKLAELLGETA
ncbi:MAG: AMP-binding protein [Burkholderiales bacterium]|nr:AMP-binding protein [Burkholderiales bacterium]